MAGLVFSDVQEDGNKNENSATHMAFLVIISQCTLLFLHTPDQTDYCAQLFSEQIKLSSEIISAGYIQIRVWIGSSAPLRS